MFIDYAKIKIRSGNGGDGHVSFRRELYVPNGGPDGGDGGKGGDIIISIDEGLNTLLPFKHKFKYFAENGESGGASHRHGKNGKDLIIKVPNGTLIKDEETNKIIVDMTNKADYVLLKGGNGGLGNSHFATGKMQAPRYAKPGIKGVELNIILELKILADVSLVGFPNVGKSSLISTVSNARPEINNYHFTTINPHLGMINVYDKEFLMVDIPGLIEGSGDGLGLGIKFLKHIERTKIILHVVDISGSEGRDPLDDLKIITNEFKKYNISLINKKQLICANKIDLIDEETLNTRLDSIKKAYKGIDVYPISVATKKGIKELIVALANEVEKVRENNQVFDQEIEIDNLVSQFNENVIIEKIANDKYKISGEKIKKMLGYTNLNTEKGLMFLQKFLNDNGYIKQLKEKGLKESDTVFVEDFEFEYYD